MITKLEDLINKAIYHLDLKLSNIMANKKICRIKLLDFENVFLNIDNKNPLHKGKFGKISYCSSEVLKTFHCDVKKGMVFTFGCLVYNCIESRRPFKICDNYINCETRETKNVRP